MENIIEKIKKLLQLAQSSNIHEAMAATKAADLLIAKFRIDRASLQELDQDKSSPVEDNNILYETARIVSWKSHLAIILSEHYGCAVFNDTQWGASKAGHKVNRYRLVGHQSDLDLTRFMFGWITNEIERLCQANCKGQGRIVAQSYCEGAVTGINSQLKDSKVQAKKAAEESGQSNALIALDNRLAESKEVMHKLHKLGKCKGYSSRRFDADAYHQGVSDGKQMHLANGLKDSNKTKQLL
jgi:hypothetical protein